MGYFVSYIGNYSIAGISNGRSVGVDIQPNVWSSCTSMCDSDYYHKDYKEVINMYNLLESIHNMLENIEIMMIFTIIIGVPAILWFGINEAAKILADRFYAHLEERKRQKEYDEMITRHEEKYHAK